MILLCKMAQNFRGPPNGVLQLRFQFFFPDTLGHRASDLFQGLKTRGPRTFFLAT